MKQSYWRIVYAVIYSLFGYLLFNIEETYNTIKRGANDPTIPEFTWPDFRKLGMYVICFLFARYIMEFAAGALVHSHALEQYPDNFEAWKDRLTKQVVHTAWYTVMTLVTVYLFAGTKFLPTYCFGTATCSELVTDWPYEPLTEDLTKFFYLQFSFHFCSLIAHEVRSWNHQMQDYNEFMLHHIITAGLIAASFLSRFYRNGVTFLFIADFSDSYLFFFKILRDTGTMNKFHKVVVALIGLSMIGVWIYMRVFTNGFCIVKAVLTMGFELVSGKVNHHNKAFIQVSELGYAYQYLFQGLMQGMLNVLGVWWLYLMLQGIVRQFKRSSVAYRVGNTKEEEMKNK